MTSGHGEDLGNGVYASPARPGQLVVTSPRLNLGWRPLGSLFGWVLRPLYRSSLPP